MPGISTGNVSSNWKKLQAQLQSTKKPDDDSSKKSNGNTTNTSIKRKRPLEKPTYLPPRHSKSNTNNTSAKKRKMGTSISTSSPTSTTPKHPSTLLTDHDIPAADLTAAYGTSRPTSSKSTLTSQDKDILNGGLHPSHRAGKYLSLDCEMVGHGPPPHADDLLARVSLVNFHGEQIYDSFVQPPGKAVVKDYRTHVSGVTPWHLRPDYARPFEEVQKTVAELLNDKILVGHALKKDMQALQLSHPRRDVRDTSRYAPFRVESRGKPPALRNLARSELGLTIQTGEHSSVEDARATMALFRKEKRGFEEENRRTFGTKRRVPLGKGKREESVEEEEGSDDEGSDEENEDEDLDDLEGLLDGEEEEEFRDILNGGESKKKKAAPDKKKKRKKKSRTKRK